MMARRPNVLFSMCDDQRHDWMGCAGHPFLSTPAMDRLAREGVHFVNAFTAVPLCAPSRASHHTGLYPHANGVFHNQADLFPAVSTWPELLQRAGYRTGFIGKMHYGGRSAPRPGFDRWVSFRGQGSYADPMLNVDGAEIPHLGYNTDILADYAERFITEQSERPWALCLWYKAPHGPFTPPPRYGERYAAVTLTQPPAFGASTEGKTESLRRRRPMGHESDWSPDKPFVSGKTWDLFCRDYGRTLQAVDDALGRALAAIDRLGLADDTLVVHTSDHGYFHGEFGLADKRWMYDPSIRVPLLLRYPALVANPGRREDGLVLSLDVPATLADLTGIGVPATYQGRSLRPVLVGREGWTRDEVFCEYFEDPPFPQLPTMVCLRTRDRKLIHYLRPGETDEFYDLAADPEERRNVIDAAHYAADVAALRVRLDDAMRRFAYRQP